MISVIQQEIEMVVPRKNSTKKRYVAAFLLVALTSLITGSAFGASETIPNDRTISGFSVYKDLAVVKIEPAFQNTQGCTNSNMKKLQINFTDDTEKMMFSTLLAAAASKSEVGFGISGCAGQYPKIYRVDPKF